MAKYRIACLPGNGIGMEVLEAAEVVLDKLELDAEYVYGDIGWQFWCSSNRPGVPHQLRNCPSPTSPKQQYERYSDYV